MYKWIYLITVLLMFFILFDRICARPSCLLPTELLKKEETEKAKDIHEEDSSVNQHSDSLPDAVCIDSRVDSEQSSTNGSELKVDSGEEFSLTADAEDAQGDTIMASAPISLPVVNDAELHDCDRSPTTPTGVASTTNHDDEPDLTSTSPMDTTTELDAKSYETSPSTSDVGASRGNKTNGDLHSSRKLNEDSTTVENCKDEVGSSSSSNVSAMDITATVLPDKNNCATSTSKHGNIVLENGSSSSVDTQNSTKKANRRIPREKCKPLFPVGFLGKQPLKKCAKLESKKSTEISEVTPKRHLLSNHAKEVPMSCAVRENGGSTHENGDVSTESDMCKALENGDSARQIC